MCVCVCVCVWLRAPLGHVEASVGELQGLQYVASDVLLVGHAWEEVLHQTVTQQAEPQVTEAQSQRDRERWRERQREMERTNNW